MSESDLLHCVEVEPARPARASVVWLHGLGADGQDFVPVVPYLGVDAADVRFVFPTAPARPVTINMGMVMPAWYDISETDLRRKNDEPGIRQSATQIAAILQREVERGVDPSHIVLAGFSQGGAIALHLGLRYPQSLAGIMALSTNLVCGDSVEREAAEANRRTPILQAHGTLDPMVPVARGEAARDRLIELGYDVEWQSYPMAHEVCPDEIAAIGTWLRGRLNVNEGRA
jgi:phospholipase/carboxylesterase